MFRRLSSRTNVVFAHDVAAELFLRHVARGEFNYAMLRIISTTASRGRNLDGSDILALIEDIHAIVERLNNNGRGLRQRVARR